jgi:hypothetical protein
METIKKQLKDIEDMIPSRFNFDFGKKENIGSIFSKINEGQDEGYYEEIKRSVYEIYTTTSATTRWRISPTLELIIKYRDIVFENGRTYVVGKTKARITDIISLFEYLQTTRNYAIFNNLLNVMLIFIIKSYDFLFFINENEEYIKGAIRLYNVVQVEQVEEVKLVNAFIYGIDDAFNVKVETEFEWYFPFITLIALLKKKVSKSSSSPSFETKKSASSSSPPDKEKDKNKIIEELKYGMAIWDNLTTSCQYKYIMEHIREYATTADTYVVDVGNPTNPLGYLGYRKLKLIYTHDKYMTLTSDGFVDFKDDTLTSYDLDDDEMNNKIHKLLKSWRTQQAFINSTTKREQYDAEYAYSEFLEASKKNIEATYNRYAETVSIDTGGFKLPLNKLIRYKLARPFSTSYDRYIFMSKKEEIAKDTITTTTPLLPVDYSKITPDSYLMEISGVNLESIRSGKVRSGKVYIYPTLSAIKALIKADIDKKNRLNKDDILKKLSVKIIYSSDNRIYVYYTNDISDTYNNVVVTTDGTWTKERTRKEHIFMRDKTEIGLKFSGPLLYKNKQLVKKLYNTIKRYNESQKTSGGGKRVRIYN